MSWTVRELELNLPLTNLGPEIYSGFVIIIYMTNNYKFNTLTCNYHIPKETPSNRLNSYA